MDTHPQHHLYGGGDKYGPTHSNSHVMISDNSSAINNSYNMTGHNIYAPNILSSSNGQSGPSVQYIHHIQPGHPGGGQGLLMQTVVPSSIGSHSPSSSSPASSIHYHQAPSGGQVMMMHSLYHQPETLSSSPSNHGHNLSAGCPLPPVQSSQFSTLQMPRRVRVIPTGTNNILTATVDDIIIAGGHQRTDVWGAVVMWWSVRLKDIWNVAFFSIEKSWKIDKTFDTIDKYIFEKEAIVNKSRVCFYLGINLCQLNCKLKLMHILKSHSFLYKEIVYNALSYL